MQTDALVTGLTGSFASGCSTLRRGLEKRKFAPFSISAAVREEWQRRNKHAGRDPLRAELQDIGNEFRRKRSAGFWAERVVDEIGRKAAGADNIVVDSIKNEAEIAVLRRAFSNFFVVAVQATQAKRWERVRDDYEKMGMTQRDFERDDVRDQIEDVVYGQQVQLCVDDADVVINNDVPRQSDAGAVRALGAAINPYLGLMTHDTPRAPSKDEIAMGTAYVQSRHSMCLKRHVGAVITDEAGNVVCTGYNENPEPMKPCYVHFEYCHKDSQMFGFLERLKGGLCPKCGVALPKLEPPYRCPGCDLSLKAQYFSDRGMRWCTALHAEERAIQNAGSRDLHGMLLYSTTFPCFNCARQISHRGVKRVIYVEPYPDVEGLWLFQQTGVEVRLFEGVKLRAFERLFKPFRQQLEAQYDLEAR